MDLTEYLAEERGRCARIARQLRIAPAWLSQMASGARPVPPDIAPQLEIECGLAVRRWDLRPGDWHRIWPELVGLPGAPDVPAAEAAEQS
jgi:DNA-binding transcriptional regulator YdaS (Cro superfamily)